jgi:putative nucleotidyltransferase with HDIG domain
MKIDRDFLRSKVARRIFLLFVLCALVPISGLAVLSFGLVGGQLREQSRERLRQARKSAGMAIVQKLHLLDTGLEGLAVLVPTGLGDQAAEPELGTMFTGVSLVSPAGEVNPLYGTMRRPPSLTAAERGHMAKGKTVLVVIDGPHGTYALYLCRLLDPSNPRRGTLIGKIDTTDLWGTETLPPMTELLVLDQEGRNLFSSVPVSDTITGDLERAASGYFEWTLVGRDYMATWWKIPLGFTFGIDEWTIVLSESKEGVLAPVASFQTLFALVILVSLSLVVLLSLGQIRRNLVPLEKLREGTRRIAEGNFKSAVDVSSGDEFEELAGSFNSMASQLERQFNTLNTMAELDRAILSTWSTRGVVDTLLVRVPALFPSDCVAVTVFDSTYQGVARSYFADTISQGKSEDVLFEVGPDEQQELREMSEGRLLDRGHFPSYLSPLVDRGYASALLLPVFDKGRLSAAVALAHRRTQDYSGEDKMLVRQIVDRVAVALSNARLLEELDRLNWGTLIALARTIDAKSPWTAGHSERAAELALKIGRTMKLEKEALDHLHRGALLHDIGKIAIPPAILDKTGRLSESEMQVMQEHPSIGARILEPIGAYIKSIPVVSQHHEWWNGEGYPDGLTGDEIDPLAQIYAVADVYDALTSDRPYRPGLSRQEVIGFIRDKSGTQFAPHVVEAFVEVMSREKEERVRSSLHASPQLLT